MAGRVRGVVLEVPVRDWWCPNCSVVDRTQEAAPHTRFHDCAGLAGLSAPLVDRAAGRVRVAAVEREDYEGADTALLQRDGNGRPIMAIITTRDDGQDCAVLAPTAVGSARA